MFLRVINKPKGKYLVIVDGYRQGDKVRQRTVKTIGYLDKYKDKYEDPIAYFSNLAKTMSNEQNEESTYTMTIDMNEEIDNGYDLYNVGYLPYKYIYNELGLNDFLINKQRKLNIEFSLSRNLQLLVFSRILFPGSKKFTYENRNAFFAPFHKGVTKDSVYDSLDYFYEYKDDIQHLLWKNSKERYDRDSSRSYYDCTNYYFDIEYNDEDIMDADGNIIKKGLRKRGPEKNHRPDPIIEMGLLMDSTGIPMAYDIFPGNESEKTSLRPILQKTKAKFGIERTIVVADRGLNTSDNIYYLAGKNNKKNNMDGYVYGQSVRGADKEFKEWVLKDNGYVTDIIKSNDGNDVAFTHKSRIYSKEIKILRNGKRNVKVNVCQKQMVYFSFKYLMKQRKDRERVISKAKELIKNPSNYTRATAYGAAGYINNLTFDKETGEVIKDKDLSLDIDKIKEEEKYDGYYSIVTSEVELDDIEIRNIYRGLAKIEDTFKVTKSNLGSRPAFVWTHEHIEGHFLTCFIALTIMRLLERRLEYKYTVDQIIESTKKYNCTTMDKNIYKFLYKDKIIDDIAKEFKVDLSKKYMKKQNIKKLLKY